MTIDLNRLKTMEKAELLDLAKQLNVPHHHNNAPETLVESIINKVMNDTLNPKIEVADENKDKAKPEPVFLTESELEEALAVIKDRQRAFSTVYDHEARCVTMRYNDGRYKHSETMSLSCSKTKFLRKAAEIARGPLVPRALKQEEWGQLGGNRGQNQYTNTVLAG